MEILSKNEYINDFSNCSVDKDFDEIEDVSQLIDMEILKDRND